MQILTDDTIAAIATPRGAGGLAVVRLSGPEAIAVAGRAWVGRALLAGVPSHTLHHGWAVHPATGARLDEVVVGVFRAPRSYTCEDVVEFSCHGGELPASGVLDALLAGGARLARPGEFTLRAFLNGRLDLTQAEAVADLIGAQSDAARGQALAQLEGALSGRLAAIGEVLADATAEVEARVDFAEDVGGIEVPPEIAGRLALQLEELDALLAGSAWARAVREGARIPLIGRPNAGKSSLFNRLLGAPRAIVTEVPGTTRDRVTESFDLLGVRVTLVDTAGVHDTRDRVEALGVERSLESLAEATLVIWVVDASRPLMPADQAIAGRLAGHRAIVALTQCDRTVVVTQADVRAGLARPSQAILNVSAVSGEGIAELRAALASAMGVEARGLDASASNERQAEALGRARDALARARDAARAGLPGELVSADLRLAMDALGEVTGTRIGEDLLERVFARFCIGK